MLTDLRNSFIVGLSNKFLQLDVCCISHRTLSVSLHYLVKLECLAYILLCQSTKRSKSWCATRPLKNAEKILGESRWIYLFGLLAKIRRSYDRKIPQNDWVYAPDAPRKKQFAPERLLQTCSTLSSHWWCPWAFPSWRKRTWYLSWRIVLRRKSY